ncbi:MAG: sulfotransferase family 2 domain-containing protein [Pseudomonadota bacterium]
MPVYPTLNLVFVHVPKTAGGAIQELLNKYKAPGQRTPINRILRNLPQKRDIMRAYIPGHATAQQLRNWMGRELWNSYSSFAVVRNPYDRLISAYEFERQTPVHHRHKRTNAMSFEEYIRSRNVAQTAMLTDKSGELMVDHLIHFENLHSELDTFFEQHDVAERLPRSGKLNSSEKKSHLEYLTEDAVGYINSACVRDFDLLGYQMKS